MHKTGGTYLKEKEYVKNLRENGIITIENYFDDSLLDDIQKQADLMFNDLNIYKQSYNTTHNRLASLDDMSYEELAVSEVSINTKEPLVNVPDFIKIAFDFG